MRARCGASRRYRPAAYSDCILALGDDFVWQASSWPDQTKNANNATATGGSPTFTAAGTGGGRPDMTFPGASSTVRMLGAVVFNAPIHIFLVGRVTQSTVTAYLWDGGGNNNAFFQNAGGFSTVFYAGTTLPGPTLPSNTNFVLEAYFNGASSFTRLNGGTKLTGNPGTGTSAVSYGLGNYTGGGDALGGAIKCAYAFSTQKQAPDDANLRQFLYGRFGITGGS